jgi:hypothetical protein
VTILTYVSVVPEIHTHLTRLAISRGGEVRVVGSASVLNGNFNTVGLCTALAKVALLEVVRRLGEAVPVLYMRRRENVQIGNGGASIRAYRDIVDLVDDVEGVNNRSVLVRRHGRRGRRDLSIHKLAGCGLGSWC